MTSSSTTTAGAVTPDTYCILNPKQADCRFFERTSAAQGSSSISSLLRSRLRDKGICLLNLKEELDLAMATIAMPYRFLASTGSW